MIYNLNGETHWELSEPLMTELVRLCNARLAASSADFKVSRLGIELCNFRSVLSNELERLSPTDDNSDLTA